MDCPICGHKLEEHDSFCSNCGHYALPYKTMSGRFQSSIRRRTLPRTAAQ